MTTISVNSYYSGITFSASEEQAFSSTVQRKMIARQQPVELNGSDAGKSFSKRFQRINRCVDQAVLTPCNNQHFFKKVRINSEQKVALAAFSFYLEAYCTNSNQSIHELTHQFAQFLNLSPSQPVAGQLPCVDQLNSHQVDVFWTRFMSSDHARKALNSSAFLFTHTAYAHSSVTGFFLKLSRFCDDIGHISLSPTGTFTKKYRHMVNQLNNQTGLMYSVTYLMGAATTLIILALLRVTELLVQPLAFAVTAPTYVAGAIFALIAKKLDSFIWQRGDQSIHRDLQTQNRVIQMTNNRLVEMLGLMTKTQNYYHLNHEKDGQPNEAVRAQQAAVSQYAQEIVARKSNNLCSYLARNAHSKKTLHAQLTQQIRQGANAFCENLISGHIPLQAGQLFNAQCVVWQVIETHRNQLSQLNQHGFSQLVNPQEKLAIQKKLLKHQMRAMFGVSCLFSNVRTGRLVNEYARPEDADRIELDENNNKVWIDGDYPFQDRQLRTHLEYLFHWSYDKIRLKAALGLCRLAGTQIHHSVKDQVYDNQANCVSRYQGIQALIHKVARCISVKANDSDFVAFRDIVPFMRHFTKKPENLVTYKVKQERVSAKHSEGGQVNSLGYILKHPKQYSQLTNKLLGWHLFLQEVAEKYVQPGRGNLGRFIDKFVAQRIIGNMGPTLRNSLSYAASSLVWAAFITPSVALPIYVGGLFGPTFLGGVTGLLSLVVALLVLTSARFSKPKSS